jgi:DamX protein
MSDVIIPASSNKALGKTGELKPSSWLTTIEFVKRLTFDNNILVAVLGEKGSGKTCFTNLLHEELKPYLKSYLMKPGHLFNRGIFLQQMKEQLGVDDDLSLSNFIAKINQQQEHVLLIIDDAQYLSGLFIEEILGELHRQENRCYFHVCLASDYSLVTVLNGLARNVYKNIVHSIELGPLSESETKQYVLDRNFMRQNVDKIITDVRVKQFYQLTAGHLADINRQMTYFFRNKAGKPFQNDQIVRHLAVAAGILIVLLGASHVWRSQDFQSILTAWLNQSPSIQINSPLVAVSSPESLPEYTSKIPTFEEAAIREEIQATPIRRADLIGMEQDSASNEFQPIVDKVIVAPKIIRQEKVERTKVNTSDKPIQKPVLVRALVEKSYYTIQILAGHNKEGLKEFIKKHGLVGKVTLRHTLLKGKDWYVITLGEYKTRQNATAAFKSLPKDVAELKPWVRLLGDLKVFG